MCSTVAIIDRITDNLENSDWESKPSLNGNRLIGVLTRKE